MTTHKRVYVCPTVTARTEHEYREQMEQIAPFATRVHVDVADGEFTPVKLAPLKQVWWPPSMHADLHVMFAKPFEHTKEYLRLAPRLVIVHAESQGNFADFADTLHQCGIQVGVALKPHTQVAAIRPALDLIDHVLIFSGSLGRFGGQADTHLLTKALLLRKLKPELEIGWDGGINLQNSRVLVAGGVNVLNVGGYIHHAAHPRQAYESLVEHVRWTGA